MNKKHIFIVGTGGHSKVVCEIIDEVEDYNIVAFIDESKSMDTFWGKNVFKTLEEAQTFSPETKNAFVAIGDNSARKRWQQVLERHGLNIPTLIHPTAWVSKSATLGAGIVICAQAVVGASAHVGDGTILNCASVVDHDARVGSYSHLSQGVLACGSCTVGANSLIGPGSVIEKIGQVEENSNLQPLTLVANKPINLRT